MNSLTAMESPPETLDAAPGSETIGRFASHGMGLGRIQHCPAPAENRQGHGSLQPACIRAMDCSRLPPRRGRAGTVNTIPNARLRLTCKPDDEKDTEVTLTADWDDVVLAVDKLDLAKPRQRADFVKRVCA